MAKLPSILIASCAALLVSGGAAQAVTIDLTTVSSGTLNGGIFTLASTQPAGSGVFDPFLTIQNKGEQQGYNSATGNFDTKREPVYNHEIRLSDLQATTINGLQYYGFDIDINEPNSDSTRRISLDAFRVYTSSTIQSSTSTNNQGMFNGSLGLLQYTSGSGNSVIINDVNSGSGESDLSVFIPVSNFSDANANDYVYVYQYWGDKISSEGGYEETRIRPGTFTPIPEVSSMLPLLSLFGAIGGFQRFRRRNSAPAE